MSDLITPAPPSRAVTVVVIVVLAAVGAWALPTAIQAGDAGELSTVMLRGGVPHPPGYPWMRILGGLARGAWALGLPAATAAALPCAAAAVVGWSLLLRPLACRTGPAPAAIAIVVAGTSHVVVLHTADAEVWGPLVLVAAIVLRLAMADRPRPWWLGIAIGLAVSHHLTAVLLVPVVVGAAWPGGPAARDPAAIARAGAVGLAGACVGLTPYLTLAIGDGGPWRWGDVHSLAGLWHHVSRADYGAWSLSLHTETVGVAGQWARASTSVGEAWLAGAPVGPGVGAALLIGVGVVALRARDETRAAVRIGGLAAAALSWLGLPAAFNLDPDNPFAAWILERFDVLKMVLWTPPFAVAIAAGLRHLPTDRARRLGRLALAAWAAAGLAHTLRHPLPRDDDTVQRYAVDLLNTPVPGQTALVFGTDDHRTFGVLFAREVLEVGDDTVYIDASLLAHPWYRAQLRARVPWLPDVDKPLALMGALWRDPEHRDTPVYLANVFSRPAAGLPRVPEGILWRVVAPHVRPPTAVEVARAHLDALTRYGPPPDPTRGDAPPWASDLAATYREGHAGLVAALRAEGQDALAAEVAAKGLAPP